MVIQILSVENLQIHKKQNDKEFGLLGMVKIKYVDFFKIAQYCAFR